MGVPRFGRPNRVHLRSGGDDRTLWGPLPSCLVSVRVLMHPRRRSLSVELCPSDPRSRGRPGWAGLEWSGTNPDWEEPASKVSGSRRCPRKPFVDGSGAGCDLVSTELDTKEELVESHNSGAGVETGGEGLLCLG